jgi:hypothetical protein
MEEEVGSGTPAVETATAAVKEVAARGVVEARAAVGLAAVVRVEAVVTGEGEGSEGAAAKGEAVVMAEAVGSGGEEATAAAENTGNRKSEDVRRQNRRERWKAGSLPFEPASQREERAAKARDRETGQQQPRERGGRETERTHQWRRRRAWRRGRVWRRWRAGRRRGGWGRARRR